MLPALSGSTAGHRFPSFMETGGPAVICIEQSMCGMMHSPGSATQPSHSTKEQCVSDT